MAAGPGAAGAGAGRAGRATGLERWLPNAGGAAPDRCEHVEQSGLVEPLSEIHPDVADLRRTHDDRGHPVNEGALWIVLRAVLQSANGPRCRKPNVLWKRTLPAQVRGSVFP